MPAADQDRFRNFLRARGLKFTRERSRIVKELSSMKRHFGIEEFLQILKKKNRKVSRASLYRTFPLLVECGLVEEIRTIDAHTYYEYTSGKEHHDHLICLRCGRIIEFHSPKLERLQNEICAGEYFSGVRHVLEIQGYCKRCAASNARTA